MRSQDRTLLASLGFSDPDKGNELHDFACQYLATHEIAEKLARRLGPCVVSPPEQIIVGRGAYAPSVVVTSTPTSDVRLTIVTAIEVPISKGSGQYKSTIGFIDATVCVDLTQNFDCVPLEQDKRYAGQRYAATQNGWLLPIAVEVKIGLTPIASIIRQVGLYREHTMDCGRSTYRWVAATAFAISKEDAASLASADIAHIRLGDAFTRYVEARRSSERTEGEEL